MQLALLYFLSTLAALIEQQAEVWLQSTEEKKQ